jgi:uncharacterized protein
MDGAAAPRIEGARVSFYRWLESDLELRVRAQPGARRTEARGMHGDEIKIRVAAPPVDGAANEALLDFVAEALQVPRRRCVLTHGATSRQKRVLVQAPDRATAERVLAEWLQTSS